MDFVAIDFETSNERRDSICGVGIAVVKSGAITRNEIWYIDPKAGFDPFNVMLHGIGPEHVKGAPLFPEALEALLSLTSGLPLVAHYTGFDMSAMRFSCDRYSIPYPSFRYGCSWQCARASIPGLINYKLNTVSEHLEIPLEHHHHADEDTRASAQIILTIAKQYEASSLENLYQKLGLLMGEHRADGYMPPRRGGHHGNRGPRNEIKLSSLAAETDTFDEEHPFFGMHIVFTGTLLSMKRADAAQKALNVGAIPMDGINSKINYLITGYQTQGRTKSAKMAKVEKMLADGYDVQIIDESDFIRML